MAYGFYGFDFSQNPLYSRLFNKDVIDKGQAAYTQGMSQFTPYDARNPPAQTATTQAAPTTASAAQKYSLNMPNYIKAMAQATPQGGTRMTSELGSQASQIQVGPSGELMVNGSPLDETTAAQLKHYGIIL